ncbi:MAG: hypothetical protein KDD66_08305 [Bdellovibrionales bacterium]|nr:hypothetical protein [Bdellovibrionales bacterium]
MKRRELEDRMQSASTGIGSAIDGAPRRAVLAAFVLGIVAATFPGIVFPLIVVAGAIVLAFWYVCEPELPAEREVPAAPASVPDPVEQKKQAEAQKSSKKSSSASDKPVNGSQPSASPE